MKENKMIGPGMLTLDQNGKPCFVLGGFPGSPLSHETGNIFPVEEKNQKNKW